MKTTGKRNMKIMITAIAGLLGLALASEAAILANYTFTGGSPADTAADPNVTAGDFTVGPGLTTLGGFSTSGNVFARSTGTFGTTVSFANASTNDDYFSVTISPNSGYLMNLTSFSFDYGYSATGSFNTSPNLLRAYITTSDDNHANFFNGNTDGYTTITGPFTTTGVNYPNSKSLDLSAAAFQNIGNIEFRIYLSDSYNGSDLIHRIDNVVLNGSLAVVTPEPSILGLIFMGSLLLARTRKKTSSV